MSFSKIKKYPIHEEIKEVEQIYAHTSEKGDKKEILEAHLNKTMYYLAKLYREKDLQVLCSSFYEALNIPEGEGRDLFNEMCLNAFYMHDIGKININFQLKQMQNPYFQGICGSNTNHALLSAAIYMEYFVNRIRELGFKSQVNKIMRTYMLLNAYVISKHHGHLKNFSEFEQQLYNLYNEYKEFPEDNQFRLCPKLNLTTTQIEKLFSGAKKILGAEEVKWGEAYIYTKLIYSLLVACDFYATSDYMEQEKIEDVGNLTDIEKWKKAYESSDTYKAISRYKSERERTSINLQQVTNINVLRSEMFLEAMENLSFRIKENLFYLEAPTGSGKTNTSIALALTLLERENKKKLFYVFPFNTLVEQTKEALNEAFKTDRRCQSDITIVNSITPMNNKIRTEEDNEAVINYNRVLLDRQFFHYPVVITSHVQLFNLFFGVGREDGVGLYQLVNSVIILDEIQSYRNSIWTEMIHFLKAYAKLLHIKIIIMSATLPRLGQLTLDQQEIPSLITERKKYFGHPLFKNRVNLDFSLLEEADIYEKLMKKVMMQSRQTGKKILIEFIKKKTAVQFYNDLVERMAEEGIEKKILLLTGDDSKWERKRCINLIKDKDCTEVILIATQLIEAGVDIDMDIGFKDISLLDSEEQFLGRINRSCKKTDCWAYFFNLDNAEVLYKGDLRKENSVSLLDHRMQQILISKSFAEYYEEIFKDLKNHNQQYNKNNLEEFRKESLQQLRYNAVKERMRLIDEDYYPYTVFLGIEIEIEEEGKMRMVDGKAIWRQYMNLIMDKKMPYAEKKVKLSQMSDEMSCFMWKVRKLEIGYSEHVGDIFYIEEGEQYMDNGKFNRERLCDSSYEIL